MTASIFLGLFLTDFFAMPDTVIQLYDIFLFTLCFMLGYTFYRLGFLIGTIHYFKHQAVKTSSIVLLHCIDFILGVGLLFGISRLPYFNQYGLKETAIAYMIARIIYLVFTYKKEDASCHKNQF